MSQLGGEYLCGARRHRSAVKRLAGSCNRVQNGAVYKLVNACCNGQQRNEARIFCGAANSGFCVLFRVCSIFFCTISFSIPLLMPAVTKRWIIKPLNPVRCLSLFKIGCPSALSSVLQITITGHPGVCVRG